MLLIHFSNIFVNAYENLFFELSFIYMNNV